MKKNILFISLLIIISSCSTGLQKSNSNYSLTFNINITDLDSDVFKVSAAVKGLTAENNIYNLPATVPGTYRVLNFGRFVKEFKAFDVSNNEIEVKKVTTNQWEISNPTKVTRIEYISEDTYDSDLGSDIFPMGATGIEKDHAIINTFGVLGYFEGRQSDNVVLTLTLPENWKIGTALPNNNGVFTASTYDHLADSPILVGDLSSATLSVEGINVNVYVQSTQKMFTANQLKVITNQVLIDAAKFISYPAAPNYTFLFSFLDNETLSRNKFQGFGALEHSYSSLYVLPENDYVKGEIANIVAHEFFHIVTPLNIHSEVIETYNFSTPVASRHLWLYEGTTEWASDIMQLRNSSITVEDYLSRITEKINNDLRMFDKDYSLEKMSINSYIPEGEKQYQNIYERGAYVAALLDLKLLQLSNGKKGLREVIISLSKKYGKNKAFKDDAFFDIFTKETYPEIGDFLNDYIRGTKAYPFKELYGLIGINYIDSRSKPALNLKLDVNEKREIFITELPPNYNGNLKTGDILIEMFETPINLENARDVLPKFMYVGIGNDYKIKVKRGDEIIDTTHTVGRTEIYGIFELNENPSEEQLRLFNIWKTNISIANE